jgi:hypothetical protein
VEGGITTINDYKPIGTKEERIKTYLVLNFYNQIRFHKGSTHTQANYQTKTKNLHLILSGNEIQNQGVCGISC